MVAIGWPGQTRNIGIANGSINGTTTGSAGMNVLDLQYKFKSGFARFFLGKSGLISRIYFTNSYGSLSNIFYYFRRTGFLSSEARTISAAFNGVCSIDAAPGGFYNTQGQIADGLPANKDFQGLSLSLQTNNLFRNHCFIPTISALALTNGNLDFCQSLYEKNLVCTNETPFKTYYAPVNKNMQHVTFDTQLGTWLKNEFKGIPQPPTFQSTNSNLFISGADRFCTSGNYSVAGGTLPSGTSISWNAGSIASIGSGQGTSQVRLDRISNGTATLTVALSKTCGINQTLTKTYATGGFSSANYSISDPDRSSANTTVDYYISTSAVGATGYTWTWPGDWTYLSGQGSSHVSLRTGTNSGYVTLQVAPACDQTSYASKYVGVYAIPTSNSSYTVSPNPTTDNVTIAVSMQKKKALIYQLKVTDQFGTVKKQYKYSSGTSNTNISLKGFISGMYTIQAFDGTSWSSVQVIKQ